MADNTSNNKRIAKNSIFMSIRMVFVLIITFYTTRVILNILGVEDYGVYNVVCGFVSMFAFLNTSMSNGIQRFFNFELGKNGDDGANKVYNTALLIQSILAIVIVGLTESFGIWYLHNKMVIPTDRMFAAEWIFQFSILSFLFIIMQAPYTAAVMAHERMGFYAVVSVIDAILKLVIVFTIPLFHGDKLIVYGILFALISVINFFLYFIYCKRYFPEIKIKRYFDKKLFGSMLGFSGWNVFGSLSGVMKEQGINLVLNFFFGPIVNAARGVASQINGGLQNFVYNITTPVRPQVVQSYARGDYERTMNLTYSVSKLSCCFLYLCALPVALEIDYILKIWLGDSIPEHTNTFVVLIILTSFVNNLNAAISGVVHASGKMMIYQIVSSCISMVSVPAAYIGFRYGLSAEFALLMVLVWTSISQLVSLFILKSVIDYSIRKYHRSVVLPIVVLILLTCWPSFLIHRFMEEGLARFLIVCLVSVILVSLGIYYFALNKSEKSLINGTFIKFKQKWQH